MAPAKNYHLGQDPRKEGKREQMEDHMFESET